MSLDSYKDACLYLGFKFNVLSVNNALGSSHPMFDRMDKKKKVK